MDQQLEIILYSGLAGITVFIGALLANLFNHHVKESPIKYEITHAMMSFGSGIILSALALVLIPSGMEVLSVLELSIAFSLGAVLFAMLDRSLAKKGGKNATILAMMMDFIPEAIALGAVFAVDRTKAILLALFIGLQNLPESFNAFRDLIQGGMKVKTTMILFFFLSFFGIAAALLGNILLSDKEELSAFLMVFAGGGILYLLVRDIIPESKLEDSYRSALGACLGFLIGILGEMLI